MKTPFTTEQFLEVLRNYNTSVFPIQIVMFVIAGIAVYLLFTRNIKKEKAISGILTFYWLWMAIAYHLVFFTTINPAAYIFSALFFMQGIILFYYGIIKNSFHFEFKKSSTDYAGIFLITFGVILYPVIGLLGGHEPNIQPMMGLPCPTTIFTFGILLLNKTKIHFIKIIIPVIWSIIGFMAAINFGIYEDIMLLISGIITTILITRRNKILA